MPRETTVKLVPIAGTERPPLARAKKLGAVDAKTPAAVSVLVRPRRKLTVSRDLLTAPIGQRRYLTRAELAEQHGASERDLDRVEEFAHARGLTVTHRSAAERRVVLSGPLSALTDAFGVRLQRVNFEGRDHRMRTGPVCVPQELVGIIEDVKGFDDRSVAKPHFRVLAAPAKGKIRPRAGVSSTSFTPLDLARLYDFPAGLDGSGECIALIELGGGYRTADLEAYFKGLGMSEPSVTAVGVDGATNSPGADADGEVMLDIEVAAAIAPKARIAVYFAPNTDQGFVDAIKTAVHDSARKPSIISISWGGPEESYSAQSLKNYDAVFQEAATLGVTILVAAGDNGSSDVDPPDSQKRVDFPSASPLVLSCGGTRLTTDAGKKSIATESVWNDGSQGGAGGGGVSTKYALPTWQKSAGVPKVGTKTGRGVPDVAGDADPHTGYQVRVNGQNAVYGGTSAVAPLWAGLLARCNQRLGKPVGFLNALLYTEASARVTFHDITQGDNGAYAAQSGWDACTGLGTPDGAKLLAALQQPGT